MPPPLPRCSRWAYSSLKLTHPCQPSPKPLSGRPAHRPFRGLLGVHSRCGLHTRAVTKTVTVYPKASDTSSPPCLLRSLPAGAVAGRGLHPLETRRLVTAHVDCRRSRTSRRTAGLGRAERSCTVVAIAGEFDPNRTLTANPLRQSISPARTRSRVAYTSNRPLLRSTTASPPATGSTPSPIWLSQVSRQP